MCGFVGCHPSHQPQLIEQAIQRITHRGPDEQGVTSTPMGTLGHARLSIVDVADSHQPMSDGPRWIVFNGEIYNFQSLRKTLPAPWKTHGDTEVILKLYAQKGPRAVTQLDGMFALSSSMKASAWRAIRWESSRCTMCATDPRCTLPPKPRR